MDNIHNNYSTSNKVPIITSKPFNSHENKALCVATRLRNLAHHRVDIKDMEPSNYLFVNPRSKTPLTTRVSNGQEVL